MTFAGIDIGSRTTKLVVLKDGTDFDFRITDTGTDLVELFERLKDGYQVDRIFATGYGRHLASASFADDIITEIKAYAIGARHLFPDCRTVIDVGGQDSKVIAIGDDGTFADFAMNDRCAAGTGKFLEVISKTIGFEIDEFGERALEAEHSVNINSMCTVFAESEVISLVSKGEHPSNIALGLHESIVSRLTSMAKRVGVREPIVFGGGVARNRCVCRLLEKSLEHPIVIPDNPQLVGALGAALEARDGHGCNA
ncbi:MAG: acyl-CoA dehydratase activase [Dehalococcoidia bacterium]